MKIKLVIKSKPYLFMGNRNGQHDVIKNEGRIHIKQWNFEGGIV